MAHHIARTTLLALGVAGLLALVTGCVSDPPTTLVKQTGDAPDKEFDDDPTDNPENDPGAFNGGDGNSFPHTPALGDEPVKDPFEILAQREEEGPPEIRTRLHSCQKLQIKTLENMLESLGVDLSATGTPKTAGQLLAEGKGALGAANYDGRVGESLFWSAAGAAKLFDIFVQAAPEIIANISTVDQCKVGGVGPQMFDGDQCNPDAVSCLIGRPATETHIAICNDLVTSATDTDKGKHIAVATMLSAAHSCE